MMCDLYQYAGPAVFHGMQIFTPHRRLCRLPLNLLLAAEKCGISRFLQHLYLIHGFSGSFLIYR